MITTPTAWRPMRWSNTWNCEGSGSSGSRRVDCRAAARRSGACPAGRETWLPALGRPSGEWAPPRHLARTARKKLGGGKRLDFLASPPG